MSHRAQICCAVIASALAVAATFVAAITFFRLAAERRWF